MGADMLLSCAPACKLSRKRQKQIDRVVRAIPEDDCDLAVLMEQLGYDNAADAKTNILQQCRTAQGIQPRIVTIALPGCPYKMLAAGGLSWGDPPSDGYTTLQHIDLCPQLWQLLEEFARVDAGADSKNPDVLVGASQWQDFTVVMTSEEYGNEHFHYRSIAEALDAVRRLVHASEEQADGIERLIGIVVNPGEIYGDPKRWPEGWANQNRR